jgi:hypothetical protein
MTLATVYTRPVHEKLIKKPRKQANPTLLQVCHESRLVALSHYELAADIDKVYINFALDTIHLKDNLGCLWPSPSESRFRYLTIDYKMIRDYS